VTQLVWVDLSDNETDVIEVHGSGPGVNRAVLGDCQLKTAVGPLAQPGGAALAAMREIGDFVRPGEFDHKLNIRLYATAEAITARSRIDSQTEILLAWWWAAPHEVLLHCKKSQQPEPSNGI
jgi:hypothetical protein